MKDVYGISQPFLCFLTCLGYMNKKKVITQCWSYNYGVVERVDGIQT